MIDPLSLLVAGAIKNAIENGHNVWHWSDDEITQDLLDCDSEIAAYEYLDVRKYVAIQRPRG